MKNHSVIDQVLHEHKSKLQHDFIKYKNHVSRVYNLCTIIDTEPQHDDQYAIASVFHDLGIWTNKTFDYLDPSIALAHDWLHKQNKQEWDEEISLMISMHHKMTAYKDKFSNTVESFRKADWIDLSFGLLKFGVPGKDIRQFTRQFPTKGFHRFLVRKTFKNFVSHPLKPLPMFKR